MKSNVCKINKDTKNMDAIFAESEKVAAYNGFNHKQTLQLRLLCEEIDGMLPNLLDDYEGNLWLECEEGVCKVNVSLCIPEMTIGKKKELIALTTSKTNAAAVGVVGKIRSSIENFFLNKAAVDSCVNSLGLYYAFTGCQPGSDYDYMWSLASYRNDVKQAEEGEAWDELEKSIIASLADDVVVGVKGKQADIIVIKKFA